MPRQPAKHVQQWELAPGARVWVYLRHSPGDNQTIDSQVTAMQAWCAENSWIIDHMYIDEGIEGSKEEREHFQEMISHSRKIPVSVNGIVVWSFSRFARSQLDSQFYKADLRKRGFVVVSKIDEVPNNEIAPIIESVIDWKNQRFLEDMSADVSRGLSYIVQLGYWPAGVPPIGYRTIPEEIGRRRNGELRYTSRLLKDDSVSDRVALAWQMKLRENISYKAVHDATRLFKNIHSYTYFFDNWLYAGILVWDDKRYPLDWEQGKRFCEPFVTIDEFCQVQRNREKRRIATIAPRSLSSRYLLTGLLHCASCASRGVPSVMFGDTKADTERRTYRCRARATGRSYDCLSPTVPCNLVDDAVLSILRDIVLTPDFVQSEVERANVIMATQGTDFRMQLHQVEQLAKEYEKRVESIVKLIEKKGLTTILERQYDEANQAWLDATTRLASLRSQSFQVGAKKLSFTDVKRCMDDFLNVLNGGTLVHKQELVKQFIERVDVGIDDVRISFLFSFDKFLNQSYPLATISSVEYGIKPLVD